MAPSPLLKIPLLFTASRLHHLALNRTQPISKPDSEDNAISTKSPDGMDIRVLLGLVILLKVWVWVYAVAECLVILAPYLPLSMAQTILGVLMQPYRDHCVTAIRFTPTWTLGCTMVCCGSYFRLVCVKTLGTSYTFDVTIKKGGQLITSGPYAVVRHPAYAATSLANIGLVLSEFGVGSLYWEGGWGETYLGNIVAIWWFGWFIASLSLIRSRVRREDDMLREYFKEDWDIWETNTPYRLIPCIW